MSENVKRYDQYPHSQFPESVDNWDNMQDVNSVTYPLSQEYNKLISSGNLADAANYLKSHPELKSSLFNAEKINQLMDGIKATQQFYKDDVKEFLVKLADSTIGIDDNVTENTSTTNTYSAKKINELTGIYSDSPIEIATSDWDESFVYTHSDPNIAENDIVEVYFNSDSYTLVSKAQIRIISDSGAGNFKLQAKKVPGGTIKIDTYKVVKYIG